MDNDSTPLPVANIDAVGTASETDPRANGVMRGSPPPADKRVVLSNALEFPNLRWSTSHWREFAPTQRVFRGTGPVAELPRNERDLAGIRIRTLTGEDMSFAQALEATYVDGFVVLHKGSIVFEEYRGEGTSDLPHLCFSVTKSMAGLLARIRWDGSAIRLPSILTRRCPRLRTHQSRSAVQTWRAAWSMAMPLRYDSSRTRQWSSRAGRCAKSAAQRVLLTAAFLP